MKLLLQKSQYRLALWLVCSWLTVAALATLWEFKLEGIVLPLLDIPYDGNFELAERWRFVLTSTGFAMLSLAVPWWLIQRLLGTISRNYDALVLAQVRTEQLARHDGLTGLINRRIFLEQMDYALAKANPDVAVMLIDLDNFKPVNDTYGHAVGDEVLCEIADRLQLSVGRWGAHAARLGGDEFAVMIDRSTSTEALSALALDLSLMLAAPLLCAPGAVNISATIGIARGPQDAQVTSSLMKCADSAMYRGKQTGRSMFFFYDAAYGEAQQARAQFEREIEAGILLGQIVPYFQPVVSLASHTVVGFEVLARWNHPEQGLLLPAAFIADVERIGAMPQMTESLLRQACRIALHWESSLTIALNVPASLIEDPSFPEVLLQQLAEESFPCTRLELEVTEDALIGNLEAAQYNLQKLRGLGISVALDDFGTGYSGLYHLTRLAIDKIKIDRSFLKLDTPKKEKMIKAILALGKGLDMEITAEGVEQMSLATWLAERGCEYVQGYLFGKPMPAADIEQMLDLPALADLQRLMVG